jgi:hypothetical protein
VTMVSGFAFMVAIQLRLARKAAERSLG